MMPNYDFLLYFGRSLYRHFWTKSIKIHELLKAFQKIFQIRPTRCLGIKAFKSYKPTKLKCSASQNYNNPQNFILAIFCPKTQILPIFLQNPTKWDVFLPKKSTILIFIIFYDHLHQGVIFGQFGHLTPTPWVTPPDYPPDYLPLCFLCPTSPKTTLNYENLTAVAFFWNGGWIINYGLFWPLVAIFQCAEQSGGNSKMPNDGFPLLYIW